MSLIRIKQLEERIASSGVFMGRPPNYKENGKHRRKLEPGEIVDLPYDLEDVSGERILQILFESGKIDVLPPGSAVPTRPLDYENAREAKLCSPTFKPLDEAETREMEKVRVKVDERLQKELSKSQPKADSPDSGKPAKKTSRKKSSSRRAALRRQSLGVSDSGEANIAG